MVQNVVIRGKKGTQEIPILVDDDGKIEIAGTITGDVTVGDVTVTDITNKVSIDTVDTVTSVTDVANVTDVDSVNLVDAVTSITNKVNVDTVDHITEVVGITNEVDVILTDEYGWEAECTPQGELRTVEPVRLVGSQFSGSTVDSNFWTAAAGTGGTVTQANGLITITNGATADNVASVTSVRTARYVPGYTNRFRGNFILSAGAANVVRNFGAFTATDGYFFQLSGTTMAIVHRKASGDTVVAQAAWDNPTGFTLDTNQHNYEIYYNNMAAWFVIDGTLVHTVRATTAPLTGEINLPVKLECKSINGGTTTKDLVVVNAFISRLGALRTENTSRFISGANTGVALKLGAGRLVRVVFYPGANGNVCQLYDSPTTTANQVGELVGAAQPIPLSADFDIPFFNGLWVVTTGANSRTTIVYE